MARVIVCTLVEDLSYSNGLKTQDKYPTANHTHPASADIFGYESKIEVRIAYYDGDNHSTSLIVVNIDLPKINNVPWFVLQVTG